MTEPDWLPWPPLPAAEPCDGDYEKILEHIIQSLGVPARLYAPLVSTPAEIPNPYRELFPATPIDQATIDKEQLCNLDDEAS